MDEGDTRRYSLAELRAMRSRGETQTSPDAPERDVDGTFWETAQLVRPDRRKVHMGLRIDADVLDWFKVRGAVGRLG